ncbi:hypothetical protein EGW08_012477 [Elysia chlorotica]|uniref:Uncharacterized protein n=1 Tax=Elysia chlorotica TaxID=188477 RepID=A0A3S0ZKD7_ELYCH|nr:hypothetical protein EGW08_012477 [Elysia chlorotica]
MGAHRPAQASLSKPTWMVVPENGLSDICIGRQDSQPWSSSQPPSPATRSRPHAGRRSLMNICGENHAQTSRENGKVFTHRGQGNGYRPDEQDESRSKSTFRALTSQILSELHGRGKSRPRQLLSSSSSESPRQRVSDSRTSTPSLRNRDRRQFGDTSPRNNPTIAGPLPRSNSALANHFTRSPSAFADPLPRSNSALNFSQRSLALNLVRTKSAQGHQSPNESSSPRFDLAVPTSNLLSEARVSSKEKYAAGVNGGARKQNIPRLRYGSNPDAKGKPDTISETSPAPGALEFRETFGSRDSGISNSDLIPLEKSPRRVSSESNYTREPSTRKRYASEVMGRKSTKDTILEVSESAYQKAACEMVGDVDIDNEDDDDDNDSVFPANHSVSPQTLETSVHSGSTKDPPGDVDEEEEGEEDDELPEYLDSFQAASSRKFRRPSMWNRVRDLGVPSLIHDLNSTRTSSLGNSVTSGVGAASIHSNDSYDSDFRQSSKKKRCPNCGEELQRAPARLVAVKGNERNFLNWLLGNWGKIFEKLKREGGAVIWFYCNMFKYPNR